MTKNFNWIFLKQSLTFGTPFDHSYFSEFNIRDGKFTIFLNTCIFTCTYMYERFWFVCGLILALSWSTILFSTSQFLKISVLSKRFWRLLLAEDERRISTHQSWYVRDMRINFPTWYMRFNFYFSMWIVRRGFSIDIHVFTWFRFLIAENFYRF